MTHGSTIKDAFSNFLTIIYQEVEFEDFREVINPILADFTNIEGISDFNFFVQPLAQLGFDESDLKELNSEIEKNKLESEMTQRLVTNSKDASLSELENFIEIKKIPDDSYKWVIDQINWAYKVNNLDSAVYLLVRKLLETALADILYLKFGSQNIDLFFNKGQRRFHNFTVLLKNFKENIDKFASISQGIDRNFVKRLSKLREKGNASAHNILEHKTRKELDKDKNEINHLIVTFFRLICLIKRV